MIESIYRFNIGQIEALVLKAGGGPRPAATLFSDAPQAELETAVRKFDFDPAALPFSMNVVLLKLDGQTILVDTGLPTSNIVGQLAEQGVEANSVDTIIITHGHGDHVGGILNADGGFVYPNAHYIIWKTEWDYWTAPDRFVEGDANPTRLIWQALKANEERVTTIGGDVAEAEALPGICAIAAPGHTIGHMALLIESGGDKLLHIADAAHQAFQMICPQWSPNFDYDKAQAAGTRKQLFERAARENLPLLAYHFTFPGLGRVVEKDGALAWEARQ